MTPTQNPPPNRRYLTPPQQLLVELKAMKSQGLRFDYAWKISLQRVAWPHDKQSRHEWKDAINDTREEWRRAYYDLGAPLDILRVVKVLNHELDAVEGWE